jgi:hypothetical protein
MAPSEVEAAAGISLYFDDFEPKPVSEFGRNPKF